MRIGVAYPRSLPASSVTEFARQADEGGLDDFWVIEDCFFTTAPTLAAAALTITKRIQVGIGILPAVVRHPAITAMELATLAELGRGRLIAGIGHGVQEWMEQIGLRPESPLTTLRETLQTVRRLLAGETVTTSNETFRMDDVKLEAPLNYPVPLLAGVKGPKSMQLAGREADGVILGEPCSPSYVEWALSQANPAGDFEVVAFAPWFVADDSKVPRQMMAPWLMGQVEELSPAVQALPFLEDLIDRAKNAGTEALAEMPDSWWNQIAPIGSQDDALAYVGALKDIGVARIGLFPAPILEYATYDLRSIIEFAKRS